MLSAKEKERELIVSLHKKGNTTRYIANILDISKSKSAFWVKRYNETGSLKNKPRSGRPSPLNKKTLNFIAGAIKSQILESEGKAGVNSKEVLQLIKAKTGKKYTLRHVQRLMHRMGFSLITPRVNHIRKDKEAQDKFRREFKKKFKKNTWAIQS